MKKIGYLVIAVAVLTLAFGSISLAYAKPSTKTMGNQAQSGLCGPGECGPEQIAQRAALCGPGECSPEQIARLAEKRGTGECGLNKQAGPRGANCPLPNAGGCGNGPCGQ